MSTAGLIERESHFAEEVSLVLLSDAVVGPIFLLSHDLDVPGEDEVETRPELSLLDDVDARRIPFDLNVIAHVLQRRRLLGEERH